MLKCRTISYISDLFLEIDPHGIEYWSISTGGRHARGRMLVGFTTTYAISTYHHYRCEFESRTWRGVLDTILCDKVCQWLATGRWFSPGPPVSSTNKTERHDIIEILLLKVALNTINQKTNKQKNNKRTGNQTRNKQR